MLSRQGRILSFFPCISVIFVSTFSQEKLSAKDKNSLEAPFLNGARNGWGSPGGISPRWKVAQLEAIDSINCCVLEHLQEMGGC